jgi:HK97 gp10 family phage protein
MASGLFGAGHLARQLQALGQLENGKALTSSVREGIKPATSKARALVPIGLVPHLTYLGRLVVPGFSKRSIRVRVTLSRDKQSASALLGVLPEAFYVVQWVELGTSRMEAQPWLRPAFESTLSQQEEGLAVGLAKFIERAAASK